MRLLLAASLLSPSPVFAAAAPLGVRAAMVSQALAGPALSAAPAERASVRAAGAFQALRGLPPVSLPRTLGLRPPLARSAETRPRRVGRALLAAAAEPEPQDDEMDKAIQKEIKRKLFHTLTVAYLGAYRLLGPPTAAWTLGGFAAAVGLFELLRLRYPPFGRLVERLFGGIMREHEKERFTGSFYTALGAALTVALFGSHPRIVTASLLALAFGDAAAAVVGRLWGRHKWPRSKKSIEGSLAMLGVGLAGGLAAGVPWPAALAAAAAITAVELPGPWPDDNLWIPLASALTLWLLL